MLTKKIEDRLYSALVLIPAGIVCLGYVLYKRDFAKLHLELSCFSFPVFVGEILLFFCACVLIAWGLSRRPALNRSYFFIALYLAWLAGKTIFGYWAWGPLAFRHAALFYYPLFFIIGYVFFNRDLFTRWSIPLLLAVILLVFLSRDYDRYWTFTLASLGFVLVLGTKEKKQRLVMLGLLLVCIPYVFLFKIARMMFVANTMSLVFLMACLWYLLEKKLYTKLAILAVFMIVLGGGFYKFFILGESGRVFVSPGRVMEAFREMDQDVQKKKIHYQPEPLHVGLYNSPNVQNRNYHYYNRDARPSRPEIVIQKDHAVAVASGELSKDADRQWLSRIQSMDKTRPQIVSEENRVAPLDVSVVTAAQPSLSQPEIVVQENYAAAVVPEERPEIAPVESVSVKVEDLPVQDIAAGDAVAIAGSSSPEPQIVLEENRIAGIDIFAVAVVPEPVASFVPEERPNAPLVKWVSGKEYELPRVEERPAIEKNQPGQQTGAGGIAEDPDAITDADSPASVQWWSVNNVVFRLFIWRDMWEDWRENHSPLFGVAFGRPLRSVSLEVLRWAEWEWRKDGWIEPHNSFFHMLYRAGIVGVILVALIWASLVRLIMIALRKRSWVLILLSAVLLNWMVAANFLLIFELPYTAIPFWLLAGMVWKRGKGDSALYSSHIKGDR